MLDIIGRRPQLLSCVAGMVVALCVIGGLIKGQSVSQPANKGVAFES
jgi:hypothetical protein